jgi:hypothetical protein
MKKITLLIVLVAALGFGAKAQQDGLGIGLIFGYPSTGVSLKSFTGDNAFDAAAAWSFSDEGGYFLAWTDYLVHNYMFGSSLPWYVGVGGFIGFGSTTGIGGRVPIGITYLFDGPFDIFVEVAPTLEVIPDLDMRVTGGFGFRYYIR